jgi:hypothetical protein
MTDPTKDIDALLDALTPSASGFGNVEMHRTDALRFRAALAALVAERDALKQRVAELERDVDMWREDAHKWKKMYNCHYESERIWISRVVELERQVESQPPADRDRELRERLIKHLEDASRVVQTWPTWKQEVLGGTAVQPPADRDRELRERLIESALQGAGCATISHQPAAELLGRQAVWLVDGAIAEMRKEDK